jgi:gentisate 1,2-dioxygenase
MAALNGGNAMAETEDIQLSFHRRISERNLSALWVSRRNIDLSQPSMPARPALWRYDEVRRDLMEAGEIVSACEAFRRVLVLENPNLPGEARITNTLFAGLQLVLPGEIAPCHRHSQTALRFIIEGEGAVTSVDGEQFELRPGDFLITPQWAWHDHTNEGAEPVVWLDGLDTPLIGFLDTVFREHHAEPTHPIDRPRGDAFARFGEGMAPVDHSPLDAFSPQR